MKPVPGADGGLGRALADERLPVDDLEEPGRLFLRFSGPDGRTAGYGGLELAEEGTVLLRSLVVLPDQRGLGHGVAITEALVAEAGRRGARFVYLLTTTAADFFTRTGFAEVERAQAPEAIVSSRQFSQLCPASAKLLSRRL